MYSQFFLIQIVANRPKMTLTYLIKFVKKCTVIRAPVPDHNYVEICIYRMIKSGCPSYWKINTSMLSEDSYKELIKYIV